MGIETDMAHLHRYLGGRTKEEFKRNLLLRRASLVYDRLVDEYFEKYGEPYDGHYSYIPPTEKAIERIVVKYEEQFGITPGS